MKTDEEIKNNRLIEMSILILSINLLANNYQKVIELLKYIYKLFQ